MTNLNKFDKILNDLETQANTLGKTAKAYEKLDNLVLDYAQINKLFKENNQKLDTNAEYIIRKHHEIKKSLSNIELSNTTSYEDIKKIFNNLRAENRQFYLDFEKIVRIKLEENKSEIKHLIEQERFKLKEIFEDTAKKNRELIIGAQKKLKTTIIIFGIITVFLLIVILFKLFLG